MISNVLGAAIMLLGMNTTAVQSSTSIVSVEPITIEAPAHNFLRMTQETLNTLINDHAVPHWGFTGTEAWNAYNNGHLIITELVPDKHYLLKYDDGILEVFIEGTM